LIQHAAHRAPEPLASRLEEEWLADLESRHSAFSRLFFAAGCCWASVVIAHEFAGSRVRASAPVAAGGAVTLTPRNFGYFSLRSATLFLIAGLHAALFYGLITSLQHIPRAAAPAPLQNQVLEPKPREREPIPIAATSDWTLNVPKPDAPRPTLPPTESEVQADYKEGPVAHDPPAQPQPTTRAVTRVVGGPGAGFPAPDDFYPTRSIFLEEEGISTVQVCVDAKGRLSSAPTMAKSSGSARLDEAALKLARAGSGHYRASTEDGQPVNSCYPLGVRFQLKR
jgi:TonB family protein